jgi:3-oxoacyl-[acyl-carrier-protein] synthase III
VQLQQTIGLKGVATALPSRSLDLEELAASGRISSQPATLARLGFERAFIADEHDSGCTLAARAAEAALEDADLRATDIDALIWASAVPGNHLRPSTIRGKGALHQFTYAGSWLQEELGLERATVMGTAQQGCAGMFSALRAARAMLLAEPELRHVLCVGVDVLPPGASREILYNVISDGACAVVVSRNASRDRWTAFHQVTNGYYWDTPALEKEIMASYFATSRIVLNELLARAQMEPAAINRFIPTGVNATSWPILLRLAGFAEEQLYRNEQPHFGHTIAADNFIFLEQIRRGRAVTPGSKLLLFTYGFGSTWSGLILEH